MAADEVESKSRGTGDEHEHADVLYEAAYGADPESANKPNERPVHAESEPVKQPRDKPVAVESVTIFSGSDRVTLSEDGGRRIDRADGSWILHKPTRDGGYREEHGGNKRPEENFVLVKSKDGRFRLADSMDELPGSLQIRYDMFGPYGHTDSPGHKSVSELAESKIQDPRQLAKFRADMIRFESRLANWDLGSLEADLAYREIERLLTAPGDKPLTPERRVKLAQEVMSQLATPTCIDQGYHNTCNVTAIESRTYARHPAVAAQLVADVALSGQYQAQDGTVVKIGPESLEPDSEGRRHPPGYGERSFASQLFQVTAVNIHWVKDNAMWNPPGQIRYEQHTPDPKSNPPDTGERLIDHSKSPPKLNASEPHLYDSAIVKVSCAITGDSHFDDIFIGHREKELGNRSGLTVIGSEAELETKIGEVAAAGRLPIIISVDTRFEPFWSDSDNGAAGGSGGAHVVTITEYHAGPPVRVGIDNQWGARTDHTGENAITVHDLYLATRPPEVTSSLDDLRKDVELNRRNGTVDTVKELTLLRLENSRKRLSEKEYDETLLRHMSEAERRSSQQRSSGTLDQSEHARTLKCFGRMLERLPKDRREAIIVRLGEHAPDDEALKQLQAEIQKST